MQLQHILPLLFIGCATEMSKSGHPSRIATWLQVLRDFCSAPNVFYAYMA